MTISFLIWVSLWFGVMGVPNYLFGIGKTNYYQYPMRHILWYVAGLGILFFLYSDLLIPYFSYQTSPILFVGIMVTTFILWMLFPALLHDDYYDAKKDRIHYQIVKIFDILYQQICLLSGFLLFGVEWYIFGVIFFAIHLPVPLVIPKRLGLITAGASLPGGLVFAYLISYGPIGFAIAVAMHFAFYATLPFIYKVTKGTPVKR